MPLPVHKHPPLIPQRPSWFSLYSGSLSPFWFSLYSGSLSILVLSFSSSWLSLYSGALSLFWLFLHPGSLSLHPDSLCSGFCFILDLSLSFYPGSLCMLHLCKVSMAVSILTLNQCNSIPPTIYSGNVAGSQLSMEG